MIVILSFRVFCSVIFYMLLYNTCVYIHCGLVDNNLGIGYMVFAFNVLIIISYLELSYLKILFFKHKLTLVLL